MKYQTHFFSTRHKPLSIERPFLLVGLSLIVGTFFSLPQLKSQTSEANAWKEKLTHFHQLKIEAASTQSYEPIRSLYAESSLLMAEYHPLMEGLTAIEHYYTQIYSRQEVVSYTREIMEIIPLKDRVIELGLFVKTLESGEALRGKFLNVWAIGPDDSLYLRAESFGYLHPMEDPSLLVVASLPGKERPSPKPGLSIPREIEAYMELGKSSVIARNPEKSTASYAEDGSYFPYADTLKAGKDQLLKHFQAYYSNPATIDSLEVWTHDYDIVEDGYILYNQFYVDWTVPGYSGNAQGSGISYRRRQADHSLRIFRHLGIHIHQE